jgi:NitT/TauT family transport system substrate-binding protein
MSKSTFSIGRRQVLQLGAAGVAASMIPSLAKAADDPFM